MDSFLLIWSRTCFENNSENMEKFLYCVEVFVADFTKLENLFLCYNVKCYIFSSVHSGKTFLTWLPTFLKKFEFTEYWPNGAISLISVIKENYCKQFKYIEDVMDPERMSLKLLLFQQISILKEYDELNIFEKQLQDIAYINENFGTAVALSSYQKYPPKHWIHHILNSFPDQNKLNSLFSKEFKEFSRLHNMILDDVVSDFILNCDQLDNVPTCFIESLIKKITSNKTRDTVILAIINKGEWTEDQIRFMENTISYHIRSDFEASVEMYRLKKLLRTYDIKFTGIATKKTVKRWIQFILRENNTVGGTNDCLALLKVLNYLDIRPTYVYITLLKNSLDDPIQFKSHLEELEYQHNPDFLKSVNEISDFINFRDEHGQRNSSENERTCLMYVDNYIYKRQKIVTIKKRTGQSYMNAVLMEIAKLPVREALKQLEVKYQLVSSPLEVSIVAGKIYFIVNGGFLQIFGVIVIPQY